MKSILLTNDDGIDAEGLNALRNELRCIAHVLVVAPEQNRSAISHGLTIHTRLKCEETGPDRFSLNGTPADCVIYALNKLFINPPDLVISGINHGSNLGNDLMYSGTVAAAREASRCGIPAIAVSQEYVDGEKIRFNEGIKLIMDMATTMLQNGFHGELLLNVNIPAGKIKGIKITRQGYTEHIKHFGVPESKGSSPLHDPLKLFGIPESKGNSSLHDSLIFLKNELCTDEIAVSESYVSITPLRRDQTDYFDAQSLMKSVDQFFGKS